MKQHRLFSAFSIAPTVLVVAILFFSTVGKTSGQIIPASRTINWNPATVGASLIPGDASSNGVPFRTIIWTNAASAGCDPKGVTDSSPILNGLLQNCPANEVIYFPPGNYVYNNIINFGKLSQITVRGAGMGQTVFIDGCTTSHLGLFNLGTGNPEGAVKVVSGFNKGSTNLTVSATAEKQGYTLFPQCMVTIFQPDDTNFVHNLSPNPYWGAPTSNTNNLSQTTMVTSVNGNNITIWPPLVWDFTNAPGAQCTIFAPGTAFLDSVEDLTIVHTNAATGVVGQCQNSIWAIQCDQCWFRNIESSFVQNYHFSSYYLVQCTVRDCYFHEATYYGPSQGAGLLFYQGCCSSLVENNIFYRCSPSMEINGASSGNVFDYNYSYETLDSPVSTQPGEIILSDFDCNHGAHNIMNLWEGNVGTCFQSDSYFGSCSHQTLFRNYFSASHALADQFLRAIDLGDWSDYFNVVGNVLGSPAMTNLSQQVLWSGNGVYDMATNGYAYVTPVIYRFGYPNLGNTYYNGVAAGAVGGETNPMPSEWAPGGGGPRDLKVEATILLADNFDYVNNAVMNPTNNLPMSLYYSAQPAWWPTNISWPPIGPDRTPMVSSIPSQTRFNYLNNPATLKIGYVYTGTSTNSASSGGPSAGQLPPPQGLRVIH